MRGTRRRLSSHTRVTTGEYIDYLNQAKLDQVEIQGKSSTRSPTDFKHKMDPSAAEFSPKGDNAADPGGVYHTQTQPPATPLSHTSSPSPALNPGGVRDSLVGLIKETRGLGDLLATAEEINAKYVERIDSAIETLAPRDLPVDPADELVLPVLALRRVHLGLL